MADTAPNLSSTYVGDGLQINLPTTPSLAQGSTANTMINKVNYTLAHMCDFSQDIKKSTALKKFLVAQAKAIREAIRTVMRALGLSDATGTISQILNWLKNKAQELRNIIKKYVKPVIDFAKFVAEYVQYCIATLAWILSLPAKFLAMFADCLKKISSAVVDVFKEAWAESASVTDSIDTKELEQIKDTVVQMSNDITGTINEAQAAGGAVLNSVNQVQGVLTGEITTIQTASNSVITDPNQASSYVSTPSNSDEVNNANAFVKTEVSNVPDALTEAKNMSTNQSAGTGNP